jgi:hypothetical protein
MKKHSNVYPQIKILLQHLKSCISQSLMHTYLMLKFMTNACLLILLKSVVYTENAQKKNVFLYKSYS